MSDINGAAEFLTTAEVATLLRQPDSTVRYWRHVSQGPRSFRAGRRVLYRRSDVEAWVSAQMAATGAGGVA